MLPNTLTPAFIAPEATNRRLHLLTALKKIEFVEVRSAVVREGECVYVIEASATSHISVAASSTRPDASALSQSAEHTTQSNRVVTRVERAYSSFDELRLNAFYSARNAHYRAYCTFCHNVVDEVSSGRHKPGNVLKLLGSGKRVEQTLTKFINALLEIVKCSGSMRECRGQDKVCSLLHDFLFSIQA